MVLTHRLMIDVQRFLSTLSHPHAVAFHLALCGQLAAGLHPHECAHAGRTEIGGRVSDPVLPLRAVHSLKAPGFARGWLLKEIRISVFRDGEKTPLNLVKSRGVGDYQVRRLTA